MSGRKVFQPATVLTAGDVNSFLMDQSVMVFDDATARGSAIGTATEGMVTYLKDTDAIEVYTTDWSSLVPATTVATAAATATAYTISADNANNVLYSLATATITVTVPDVLNIGERVDIWRDGAGTVTLAAGTGVTSWAGAGTAGTAVTFKIDEQYSAATLQKVAANTYRVVGKIAV
jgi:hypothetical protein